MRSYTINKQTFHILFPDEIPPLTPDERQRLKDSIRENGVKIPIVIDNDNGVIDGENRLSIAAELSLLGIPTVVSHAKTTAEKRELCKSLNRDRRHMTVAQIAELREKRIEKVAAARAEGKSQRAIAEEVGVSRTQVQRDLEEIVSGGPPGPPDTNGEFETTCDDDDSGDDPIEAPVVTGKDGKKYSAKKPSNKGKREQKVKDWRAAKKDADDALGRLVRSLGVLGMFEEYREVLQKIKTAIYKLQK